MIAFGAEPRAGAICVKCMSEEKAGTEGAQQPYYELDHPRLPWITAMPARDDRRNSR
jgi:hypothetical protein